MRWTLLWKRADAASAERQALERLKNATEDDWLALVAAWAKACSERVAAQAE